MSHYAQPNSNLDNSAVQRKHVAYAQVRQQGQPSPAYQRRHEVVASSPDQSSTAVWHVGWKPPAKMLGFLALGATSAVGHHLFYASLHSTPVRTTGDGTPAWKTQEWVVRYGLILAFLTKILLSSAVAAAYKQYIWTNLRKRPYTVAAINSLFDAASDIMALTNGELLAKAKMATFLAFLIWTIPLSALITPSALLVTMTQQQGLQRTMSVPALSFESTVFELTGMAGDVSPLLARMTSATASSAQILPMDAVEPNATYEVQFDGPSLKCEQAQGFEQEFMDEISEGSTLALGVSTVVYYSITPHYRYADATGMGQYNLSAWDFPKMTQECLKGPGACPFEPPGLQGLTSFPMLVHNDEENLVCSLHITTYSIRFQSTETTQTIVHPYSFEWKAPANIIVQDLFLNPYYDHSDATRNTTYRMAAQALSNLFNGAIGRKVQTSGPQTNTMVVSVGTAIMQTALAGALRVVNTFQMRQADLEFLPAEDRALARNMSLGALIEELSRNQTLSLFSNPRFWANESMTVEVTQDLYRNIWEYRVRFLWISYGLAILATSFGVTMGLLALYRNGMSHDTTFGTIMATTRNTNLDDLTKGSSLGGESIAPELLKTKLVFGVLEKGQGNANMAVRAAFGLPAEMSYLRKGQEIN